MIRYLKTVLLFCAFTAVQGEVYYSITNLGTLAGTESRAYDVNGKAEVVGWSYDANTNKKAFLWTNGVMIDLGTIAGHQRSEASGINNRGEICGTSYPTSGTYLAVLWTNRVITNLPVLRAGNSVAFKINEQGNIIGRAKSENRAFVDFYAYMWTNMIPVEIGHYDNYGGGSKSYHSSNAQGINNFNQVAGLSHYFSPFLSSWRSMVFEDKNGNGQKESDEMTILGTLGGDNGIAAAINDFGEIVGHCDTTNSGVSHAYLITPTNGVWKTPSSDIVTTNYHMKDLGTLPGGNYAEPLDINNAGTIVGSSRIETNDVRHAFISYGDTLIDLNDMISTNSKWELKEARAINDSGQIVGYGIYEGATNAFLMTPTNPAVQITHIFGNETQHVQNASIRWRGEGPELTYTLYGRTSMTHGTWYTITPTNQWPTFPCWWSGSVTGENRAVYYRVIARPWIDIQ